MLAVKAFLNNISICFSVFRTHQMGHTTGSEQSLNAVRYYPKTCLGSVCVMISQNYFPETESIPDKRARSKPRLADTTNQSLSAAEQKFAADIRHVEDSNDKMKELNADLDTVLDRLQQILTNNFAMDGTLMILL